MKKLILSVALFGLCLSSCKKENVETSTPAPTILDCEKNHTGTLRVVNANNETFYIYIENVYVLKVDPWAIGYYENVPSSSSLEVKAINVDNSSDVRTTNVPFSDCTTTEVTP